MQKQEGTVQHLNRRSLLTSSGAVVAAAILPTAEGQTSSRTSKQFTVRSGEGRHGGPWLVHGDKAFSTKVSGRDVDNKYVVIEIHTPPGHGPELHVHPGQNEMFYILSGSIGVQCGVDRTVLKAGDVLMAPADTPHAFVTLGTQPAHMLNIFDPAGDMEGFFADYAPIVDVNGEPDRNKLAAVYAKHGVRVVGPALRVSEFSISHES